jgi:nitrogen-specific signal transduction histidine kinase
LDQPKSRQLREILHDLSNVLTGISVTGGLLQLALQGDRRRHYAVDICAETERSAKLVRRGRSLLVGGDE